MSPLAFQTSGKVALPTQLPQPKQPPKMEIAPLTQDQLVQALTYLLKVIHVTVPISVHGYKWKMVSIALRRGRNTPNHFICLKTKEYLKRKHKNIWREKCCGTCNTLP